MNSNQRWVPQTSAAPHQTWTVVLASVGVFMTALDTLVVTTSLPVLRQSLHASLSSLEWTVNAYNLAFACLLLTGAALGDRFGRRRMFTIGIGVFTVASVASALSPSIGALLAGIALIAAFIEWERRASAPMLQLAFFRDRTYASANAVSFFMYAALFGALFLMAQFLQIALGHSPLGAGVRLLPWTGAPMV